MQAKRLTQNGLSTPHLLYILVSLGMIAASIYLTNHFYDTFFPSGIKGASSLCSINSFWGCDKATTSTFGSLFNVPTSFFGIIIGIMGIFGAVFPSEDSEKTTKFFIYLNAVGCVILFIYSLAVLKSLCPVCTIYYVLSFIAAFLFFKFSSAKAFPEIKPLALYATITIVPSFFMYNHFIEQQKNQNSLSSQYINQYANLAVPGDPIKESPYKIHMSTKNFADAPLRITVFSDFQCPFCSVVSEQMHPLIKEFDGKINIQYMFYPLDNACNPNIKSSFHQFACKAAYLAACDKTKFSKVHDFIFANQKELSFENLDKWEKDFGLSRCFKNSALQEEIMQTINAGTQYSLKSTPTLIINGKKIEGTIPTVHLKSILRSLLKK